MVFSTFPRLAVTGNTKTKHHPRPSLKVWILERSHRSVLDQDPQNSSILVTSRFTNWLQSACLCVASRSLLQNCGREGILIQKEKGFDAQNGFLPYYEMDIPFQDRCRPEK
jgi:hypothetical protein